MHPPLNQQFPTWPEELNFVLPKLHEYKGQDFHEFKTDDGNVKKRATSTAYCCLRGEIEMTDVQWRRLTEFIRFASLGFIIRHPVSGAETIANFYYTLLKQQRIGGDEITGCTVQIDLRIGKDISALPI